MIKMIYGFFFGVLFLFSIQVSANELLVLSGENSKNSKRWENEVFNEYIQSAKGEQLPAKIIAIQGNNFPKWFAKAMEEGRVGEILGTPTFIIWDEVGNKEVGRIEGSASLKEFQELVNLVLRTSPGVF